MRTPFDPRVGYVAVPARFWGPLGDADARLALDTGAARTVIHPAILQRIGYSPLEGGDHITMITGRGALRVPVTSVVRVEAIGRSRQDLRVICHGLPAGTGVDGVLGLDFMRDQCLTIDFRDGWINLD